MGRCFLCLQELNQESSVHCLKCDVAACSEYHMKPHQGFGSNLCLPFRVDKDDLRGRHFIATRDIAPLELILIDKPAISGPAPKSGPVCLECLRSIPEASVRCEDCGFPVCEECLKGPVHSKECEYLKGFHAANIKIEDIPLIYPCVLILRMALLKVEDEEMFSRMTFLTSGDSGPDPEQDFLVEMMMQSKLGLEDLDKIEARKFFGILKTNASSLNCLEDKRGTAIFPTFSLINGSCFGNIFPVISPDDLTMQVRAQRSIKTGEEISTRYLDPLECQPLREVNTWTKWRYFCQCQRCLDKTEFDTQFSTLKCLKCGEFLLPDDVRKRKSAWKCETCGDIQSQDVILERLRDYSKICEKAMKMPQSECWKVIKILENFLHPNHQLIFSLKRHILLEFSSPASDAKILQERVELCENVLDTMEKFDPGYSMRKGPLLAVMIRLKMSLAKILSKTEEKNPKIAELKKESRKAMKEMALCMNFVLGNEMLQMRQEKSSDTNSSPSGNHTHCSNTGKEEKQTSM